MNAAGLDAELCRRLATACGILARQGLGDMIWGHVSVRSAEDPQVIHIKPHKMGLEEIKPEDIIGVNLAGERIIGERPKHIETFIHTEIMRARPDINSVVHVHASSAVVFSALDTRLRPIGHEGALFHDSLKLFNETTDLISTPQRGAAVARTLADSDALILQNHGLVTAADTLEGAVLRAMFLDKACRAQLDALSCGGPHRWSSDEDCEAKRRNMLSEEQVCAAYDYLVRRLSAPDPPSRSK